MKITVIGAGNVGATCADVLAHRDAAHEIIMVDIKPGIDGRVPLLIGSMPNLSG
jgi:malate/lactate dehydrogenase